MKPGVPMRARYRHTHWIGVAHRAEDGEDIASFDINMMNNGQGWARWRNGEPSCGQDSQECVPRADGKCHITHASRLSAHDHPPAATRPTSRRSATRWFRKSERLALNEVGVLASCCSSRMTDRCAARAECSPG